MPHEASRSRPRRGRWSRPRARSDSGCSSPRRCADSSRSGPGRVGCSKVRSASASVDAVGGAAFSQPCPPHFRRGTCRRRRRRRCSSCCPPLEEEEPGRGSSPSGKQRTASRGLFRRKSGSRRARRRSRINRQTWMTMLACVVRPVAPEGAGRVSTCSSRRRMRVHLSNVHPRACCAATVLPASSPRRVPPRGSKRRRPVPLASHGEGRVHDQHEVAHLPRPRGREKVLPLAAVELGTRSKRTESPARGTGSVAAPQVYQRARVPPGACLIRATCREYRSNS